MRQWMIEGPEQLTFGHVDALDVRIVAGRLAVLASDGPPTLEVAEFDSASPLLVTYDEDTRRLSVTYKDLTWDGMLGWFMRYTEAHPATLAYASVRQWQKAAQRARSEG